MTDKKSYEQKSFPPGAWPECELGKYYKVLHEWDKGHVGRCTGVSETSFGHRHAELEFSDGHRRAFRTHDLELVH